MFEAFSAVVVRMAARWSFACESGNVRTGSEIGSGHAGSSGIKAVTPEARLKRSPAGFRIASGAATLGPVLRHGIGAVAGVALVMLAGTASVMAASPLCLSASTGKLENDAKFYQGTYYEWVGRLKIGSNETAVPTVGYHDGSGTSIASLTAGNSYPVEVDVYTNEEGPFNEHVKIWLDLNQDGDIDSISELVYSGTALRVSKLSKDRLWCREAPITV